MINFIIMPALALVLGWVLARVGREAYYRKVYGLGAKEYKGLSWVSQQLVKEYRSLPAANRPYANINAVVKALDTKHTVGEVNSHFRERGYEGYAKSWSCRCYNNCKEFPEYFNLHTSFQGIHAALADQQYKFALAGVSDSLNEAERLTTALREEKNLINQVTEELA